MFESSFERRFHDLDYVEVEMFYIFLEVIIYLRASSTNFVRLRSYSSNRVRSRIASSGRKYATHLRKISKKSAYGLGGARRTKANGGTTYRGDPTPTEAHIRQTTQKTCAPTRHDGHDQDARKLEFPTKFDAVWLGSYLVNEVFPNNSLQLETLNGELFLTRTSGSRCKQYRA